MRYWNTGDGPTNANLSYLESLAKPWRDITVDHFMDKVRGVIGVEKMLPKAVWQHFNLPYLFIGDDAYRWSRERFAERVAELCGALEAGLVAAHADPTLRPDGGADLSDRSATRGEEIAAALDAYRDYPGSTELSNLRQACSGTRLNFEIDQLMKWRTCKQPSANGHSIEYEIACLLGDIGRSAGDHHHEPASWRFSEARRSSAEQR